MISIAYCPHVGPDHPAPVVVAGGEVEAAAHYHESDGLDHPCTVIHGVPEDTPNGYPWTCGDGTIVNDADQWLGYLGRFVP